MIPSSPLKTLLLALILVWGQTLAWLHVGEHRLLTGDDDPACEVCLHLHKLGAAIASPAAALPAMAPARFFEQSRERPSLVRRERSLQPIRGPPTLSFSLSR